MSCIRKIKSKPLRPTCHLDTKITVFWQFGHTKVHVRICWWWLFIEDKRGRSCVTFIVHTKQLLASKSKIGKYIGFIILVVCTLYHTLDTQMSIKPLFRHPVSKFWLRPCLGKLFIGVLSFHSLPSTCPIENTARQCVCTLNQRVTGRSQLYYQYEAQCTIYANGCVHRMADTPQCNHNQGCTQSCSI